MKKEKHYTGKYFVDVRHAWVVVPPGTLEERFESGIYSTKSNAIMGFVLDCGSTEYGWDVDHGEKRNWVWKHYYRQGYRVRKIVGLELA
jgi:hypothetical protein